MTVEELCAIEEIRTLRLAYTAHLDALELDPLLDLFTEDATCFFGTKFGTWQGIDLIREKFAAMLAHLGEPFTALHVVTNPWVKLLDADRAYGRWYLVDIVTQQAPDGGIRTRGGHDNPFLQMGLYEDECRRIDGRWKLARVRLSRLWPRRDFNGLMLPR